MRPRVLFVTSQLDAVGGIPRYSRALVTALSEWADVRVADLGTAKGAAAQVRAVARVIPGALRHRPDLVVLGHVGLGPLGLLWRAAGGRYVVVAYGIEVWGPPSRLVSETLRRAGAVWPISSWTRTEVLRTAPGATVGPVLGGNVGPHFFQDHDPVEGPFRILFVATLDDLVYKGLDTLVAAAQLVDRDHPTELRIVGSGAAGDSLTSFLAEHDRAGIVRVVGRVDDEALMAEYRQASVAVLVSRFRRGVGPRGEGLGLVPLEASAAGTPVIVGSQGGSVDTVVVGQTGFMVEPGSIEQLATALRRLAEDPGEGRRMGANGREFVRAEHSQDAFSGRVRTGLAMVG